MAFKPKPKPKQEDEIETMVIETPDDVQSESVEVRIDALEALVKEHLTYHFGRR